MTNRHIRHAMFLAFVLLASCGWVFTDPALAHYTPVPQVDPYRGTPPPTATDDPLHYPAMQPTTSERSAVLGNGIRCDVNNSGTCNGTDVQIVQTDIASTARAPRPTATARPTSAATATARPSATSTRAPTPTLVATATSAPQSTATAMPMPTPGASCFNCVTVIEQAPQPVPNLRGLPCPTWAHDYWLVQMGNGRWYRTWHPAVQPDDLPGAGCIYDHTHGPKDPRLSHADNALPAYGYVADLHGMSEPHVGFKTEYQNAGECNVFEGFCATSDVRATFHQGTLGAGRVAQRFHSFEFDLKNSNGAEVHVKGMGDTGFASNQCVPPDQLNTESGTIGVRFFAMPKPLADSCGVGTPYEVWEWALDVGHDNRVHAKLGTFDAITALNPATGLLEPVSATWPNAPFGGCKQDAYFGPVYLSNNMDEVDAHGLRQIIKVGPGKFFPLDTVGKSAFKNSFDQCGAFDYTNN